jgi:hypothetical protein
MIFPELIYNLSSKKNSMRNIFVSLALLPALLLTLACSGDDTSDNSGNTNRMCSLTVQMPLDYAQTRVGLSPSEGSKDMIATWQEGDLVQVIVAQGTGSYSAGKVKVSDISADGKQAMIYFSLPEEIDRTKSFTVYNYTGIEGSAFYDDNGFWYTRSLAELQRAPLSQFRAPMFAKVEMENNMTPILSFKHFGTYELLHVKNTSSQTVAIAHHGFDQQLPWYQAAAFVDSDDGNQPVSPSGEWDGEGFSDALTIAAGAEGVFASWYIPSGYSISDTHLKAKVDGREVTSSNTFSSDVTLERGHAYHMYATWDGEKLSFDKGSGGDVPAYTSCPDSHHPHLIDLGLPSGTKWACCNVGAEKPEDYGGYYAWGETTEKSSYYWSTYIHCDGSSSTYHDIGKDIADTQYDAATANWGSPWVMPSLEQMNELKDKCTSKWTTENYVSGCRFTGPNGASIFLPAAGRRWKVDRYGAGSYGKYWSSSLNESGTSNAWLLYFISGSVSTNWFDRYSGQSVRPVRK